MTQDADNVRNETATSCAFTADTVVWVVETQDDDPYSPWYIDSVHAAFATADSRIKHLADEYPEWVVRTRSFTLRIDGGET